MIANRDEVFSFMLVSEGGLSLSALDNGNYVSGIAGVGPLVGSKYGVSAPVLARYIDPEPVTAAVMAALTKQDAEAIWDPGYWTALRCPELDPGVDLMVCDHGYNRGLPASGRVLQRLAGVTADGWIGAVTVKAAVAWAGAAVPDGLSPGAAKRLQWRLGVAQDGVVGDRTRTAVASLPHGHLMAALCLLADAQVADYRTLARFNAYGHGWIARTWDRLEAALSLIPKELTPCSST